MDDTQFDAFAGLPTPQTLALQRAMNQQALYAQSAQTAGSGRDFGARNAGITLGSQLGAGGSGNILDRMAQQNQQILSQPPPGAAPGAPQGASDQQGTSQAAVSPYEARAQDFEQKAKAFYAAGNYSAANQFLSAAQIARKQGLDAQKTQAESFKDASQGQEANANNWEVKPVQNPNMPGGLELARVNKLTGEVKRTGAPAPPQTPAANITMNMEKPFLGEFAGQVKAYSQQADEATTSLGLVKDLRSKLNAGVITGAGADFRTNLGNILQTAGFQKAGPNNPVANTQAFAGEALQMALTSRPAGQRLTQSEWNALKGMAGGNTNDSEEGIRAALKVRQYMAESAIKKYNGVAAQLSKMAKNPANTAAARESMSLASQMYDEKPVPSSEPDALDPVMTPAQVRAAPSGTKYTTTYGTPGVKP